MVAQRRFGPLIVGVFVALIVVLVRLFQVQVVEHEVWAQQAMALVRSQRALPSHRGSILDRNGTVLVRDTDVYQIELRYRDFRRGHPLGLLAHARSSLEMRAVPLAEAFENRAQWLDELVRITPQSLDAFARGAALDCGTLHVAAAREPVAELRSRRAADVRWYIARLLGLETREHAWLRPIEESARARAFLDLVAEKRAVPPATLLARVESDAEAACAALAALAELPIADDHEPSASDAGGMPRLLSVLEEVRSDLEDESADELFSTAAGFDAGRVSTGALASTFDLDWIARLVGWDRARLDRWIASRRSERAQRVDGGVLPRILVQVDLEEDGKAPERLLDELARLWRVDPERDDDGHPPPWRGTSDLAVLDELPTLFADTPLPSGARVPDLVLPFQDDELRATKLDPAEPWKTVGLLSDLSGKDQSDADEPLREPAASAFWSGLAGERHGLESGLARVELQRVVHALDRRHAAAADRLFAALRASRAPASDSLSARLSFTAERLKRAETHEKYVLLDRGNRPLRLFAEPPYELVERVARHPEMYRGFDVVETTRRDHLVLGKDGDPCASLLVGDVRKPFLREMLQQSPDEQRLAELRSLVLRNDDEEREMKDLRARLQIADEWTGGSGLEDYLDRELRGKPGWSESRGLEEHARSDTGAHALAAEDGQDVQLTIDADLQLAAQDLLAAPPRPPDVKADFEWLAKPVGAIVLLSSDGDVLAAASAPAHGGDTPVEGRDEERRYRRERTLRRPTFQPPGSVFKPFIGAFALGRKHFDPAQRFLCELRGQNHGGFETMNCLEHHDWIDMHHALAESCNSFFAQVGALYDADECVAMLHTFGFGQPCGIRCFEPQDRTGLAEDWRLDETLLRKKLENRSAHLQFANGLSVIEATPMQIARGMAAIATGVLPDVRLVERVGDKVVAHHPRPIDIDAQSLDYVRASLRDTVDLEHGTAHKAFLDAGSLGFRFSCKTGSADYARISDAARPRADDNPGKMRKHTWVAGWFPSEAPRAILVVFLHDTTETSTHTAVYLASDFLRTPAVKAFVARAAAQDAR